jgi:hypothetical protein
MLSSHLYDCANAIVALTSRLHLGNSSHFVTENDNLDRQKDFDPQRTRVFS